MSLSHALIGGIYALLGQMHSYAAEMKVPCDQEWLSAIAHHMLEKRVCALVDQIKSEGFSIQEFIETKRELETCIVDSKEQADVPYSFALAFNKNLLEAISVDDVSNKLNTIDDLLEKKTSDAISIKEHVTNTQTMQELIQDDLFQTLPLNDGERKIIASIITTMADKNVLKLGLMKRTLEKRGKKIHHVHPFRFLGYVFSTPHLKNSMHKIRKSSFKWDGFMDGLSKKMSDESHNGNLIPYVHGFSSFLNVDYDHVMHYVHHKDWEGLVRFLL